ncbi:MAG: hypothetical protein ACM3U2_05785 [Deltaproteobacteria bacterium]
MTDRKKPGMAFWATVVVVCLPLLYVLSFGPACWITSWTNIGARIIPIVYRPITRCLSSSAPVDGAIRWFSNLGAARGWGWSVNGGGSDLLAPDGPGDWQWGPIDFISIW